MYHTITGLIDPFLLSCLVLVGETIRLWFHGNGPRHRCLLTFVVVTMLVVCSPAAAYLASGSLEWSYPPNGGRPQASEAIVVLSGNLRPLSDDWTLVELGPDTLYRCLAAVRLYRDGEPCPIYVTGGKVDETRPGPTLARAMRDFLVQQGVRAELIFLEEKSSTTFENALLCSQLLKQHGISRAALVTDATHLRRAERCFAAQGIGTLPHGCSYRARRFEWSLANFLPNPSAAKDLKTALHEWVGLAWYKLKGRI